MLYYFNDAIGQCKMRTFALPLRKIRRSAHVRHNSLGRVSTKLNYNRAFPCLCPELSWAPDWVTNAKNFGAVTCAFCDSSFIPSVRFVKPKPSPGIRK